MVTVSVLLCGDKRGGGKIPPGIEGATPEETRERFPGQSLRRSHRYSRMNRQKMDVTSRGDGYDRAEQGDLKVKIGQKKRAEEDVSEQGAAGGLKDEKKVPKTEGGIKKQVRTVVQREAGRKTEDEESRAFARGSKIARTPTKGDEKGRK